MQYYRCVRHPAVVSGHPATLLLMFATVAGSLAQRYAYDSESQYRHHQNNVHSPQHQQQQATHHSDIIVPRQSNVQHQQRHPPIHQGRSQQQVYPGQHQPQVVHSGQHQQPAHPGQHQQQQQQQQVYPRQHQQQVHSGQQQQPHQQVYPRQHQQQQYAQTGQHHRQQVHPVQQQQPQQQQPQQQQAQVSRNQPGHSVTNSGRASGHVNVDWARALVLNPVHESTASIDCENDQGGKFPINLSRDIQYSMVSRDCLSRAATCMKQQHLWCLEEGRRSGNLAGFCQKRHLNPKHADCETQFAQSFCTAERITAYPCPTSCVYDEYRFSVSCAGRGGTVCERKTFHGPTSVKLQNVCVSRNRCSVPSISLALATFFSRERVLRIRPDTPELQLSLEDERVVCTPVSLDYSGRLAHLGETASATRSTSLQSAPALGPDAPLPNFNGDVTANDVTATEVVTGTLGVSSSQNAQYEDGHVVVFKANGNDEESEGTTPSKCSVTLPSLSVVMVTILLPLYHMYPA